MKMIILFFTIGAALMLSGCTDQQAREYTAKINAILQNYEGQIKRNIDAEQRSYQKLAAVYETEKQRDAFEPLITERALRSAALSSALVEGSAKASAISAELESYASTDFDRAQKIFAEEMDAESSYLRVLDSLQAQSKKGSDLAKILTDLAKPPGLLQRAKDIDAFVQAFQTESAKQSCLQLQSSADVAQANADDAKSIADGLQVKAAALKAKLPPSPTAQEAAALATAQDKAKQAKDKSDQAATKATDAKAELEKNANYKKDTKKCQ